MNNQNELSRTNRVAWETSAFEAWVKKYGEPEAAASQIASNPEHTARRILPHLQNPKDLLIANPLGSHGRLATALSLLGAKAKVFDISSSNAKYGTALAKAAGASVEYVVGDFVERCEDYHNCFDATVMELGILHYFHSLPEFVSALVQITKPNGIIILVDFHPFTKKLLRFGEDRIEVGGDYFSTVAERAPTPYEEVLGYKLPPCLVRRWKLSDILSAFLVPELGIVSFSEEPAWESEKIPGIFTLVVKRHK